MGKHRAFRGFSCVCWRISNYKNLPISIGRTRGIQKGIIVAYAYEQFDNEKWSVYTDLLIVGEQPEGAFFNKGDSGKLK